MPTLMDRYDTGETNILTAYGGEWKAQTFIAGSYYSISSVQLKIYGRNLGIDSTITVSIRNVDSNDKPTGVDLCVSNLSCNSMGDGSGSPNLNQVHWTEFVFSVPAVLIKDNKYAIVMRCPSSDAFTISYPCWAFTFSGNLYTSGRYRESSDSGNTWASIGSGFDFLFKTYGDGYTPGASSVPDKDYYMNWSF